MSRRYLQSTRERNPLSSVPQKDNIACPLSTTNINVDTIRVLKHVCEMLDQWNDQEVHLHALYQRLKLLPESQQLVFHNSMEGLEHFLTTFPGLFWIIETKVQSHTPFKRRGLPWFGESEKRFALKSDAMILLKKLNNAISLEFGFMFADCKDRIPPDLKELDSTDDSNQHNRKLAICEDDFVRHDGNSEVDAEFINDFDFVKCDIVTHSSSCSTESDFSGFQMEKTKPHQLEPCSTIEQPPRLQLPPTTLQPPWNIPFYDNFNNQIDECIDNFRVTLMADFNFHVLIQRKYPNLIQRMLRTKA